MKPGITLILLGLGAAFLATALLIGCHLLLRRKKCTAEGRALVTEIRIRSDSDSRSYHPVYEYWVDGVRYTGTGAYISHRVPPVGSEVDILYDPDNPRRCFIRGYDDKALRILCLVFSAIGCVQLAICAVLALAGLAG